jgi:hypothetical protein
MSLWTDIIGYILISTCSFVSFLLGISTDFFGLFPNPTNANFASLGMSLLILLIGDRITSGLRDRAAIRQVGDIVNKITSSVPLLDVINEFPNSNDALDYLCARLPYATAVLNTRVSDIGVAPRTTIDSKWGKTILRQVKAGLVFKDIVSPAFAEYAKKLALDAGTFPTGKYEYAVLANTPPSFLNFIVLEYKNGDQEVLIGWAASVYKGMEQRAYKVRDKRMISYFRDYHGQLYMLAKENAS